MLIFGITLSGEIKNLPISIEIIDDGYIHPISSDELNFAGNFTEILENDDRIQLHNYSYLEGISKVEKGEVVAAILIPANFTRDLILQNNVSISIYIDGTKPQIKLTAYIAIREAIQDVYGGDLLTLEEELAFGGAEFSSLDVSIPQVIGIIMTFLILLLAILTVIREDTGKTKLRLFTTPLTSIERILGYSIALSILTMIETGIILMVAIFIFQTAVQGSIWLLILAGYIFGMAHIFLEFFLSNYAKNEFQAVQFAILVAVPALAFSGMLIPISSLPPIVSYISKVVPLTYGITIFEGIMLRGWGLSELWFEFTYILGLTIFFFILALLSATDKSKD